MVMTIPAASDGLDWQCARERPNLISVPLGALLSARVYRAQMCKLGGNVTRIQLEGNQTHFSTPGKAAPLYVAWIKDLIAGKQVQDGCK